MKNILTAIWTSSLMLLTLLAGGATLFAINYGIFLLKLRYGSAFNTSLVFLLVAGLIAGSICLLRKKGDG